MKLKEVIRENDELFFVFEYMTANLYELMKTREKHFPENMIRNHMYQIFQGLAFMHKHGFFHRDIKPANIMYDPNSDTYKITDYGLAKVVGENNKTFTLLGTPLYQAPEIWHMAQ